MSEKTTPALEQLERECEEALREYRKTTQPLLSEIESVKRLRTQDLEAFNRFRECAARLESARKERGA